MKATKSHSLGAAFGALEQAVQAGAVPGVAAAVGIADGTLRRAHYGFAQLTPHRRPLAEDALFDFASLTKIESIMRPAPPNGKPRRGRLPPAMAPC